MFSVIKNDQSPGSQETDRILDHVQIFIQGRLKDICNVQIPGFSKDSYGLSLGLKKRFEIGVKASFGVGLARRAKSYQQAVFKTDFGHLQIKLHIFRIRARPAALDILDPQFIQFPGDEFLVHHGIRDTLSLRAVS